VIQLRNIAILILVTTANLAQEGNQPSQPQRVFSVGGGFDTGIFGIKYEKWLKGTPFIVGTGFGIEGIVPQLQYVVYQRGSISLFTQVSILYSPFEFLIFGKNTIILAGGGGIQFWAITQNKIGLYLNISAGIGRIITGEVEGNSKIVPYPNFQLGVVF